jgi:phenylacetate-CoA ligase
MPETQAQQVQAAWQEFLDTPLDVVLTGHTRESAEQAALRLFQSVAATVPAYQQFLAEQGIDPAAIQTFADFQNLPPISKQHYVLRYPLPELCRGGRLEDCDMIAVSSGSTGQPTFWPRFLSDELRIARRFEQVFHVSGRLLQPGHLGRRHVHRKLLPLSRQQRLPDHGHHARQ